MTTCVNFEDVMDAEEFDDFVQVLREHRFRFTAVHTDAEIRMIVIDICGEVLRRSLGRRGETAEEINRHLARPETTARINAQIDRAFEGIVAARNEQMSEWNDDRTLH